MKEAQQSRDFLRVLRTAAVLLWLLYKEHLGLQPLCEVHQLHSGTEEGTPEVIKTAQNTTGFPVPTLEELSKAHDVIKDPSHPDHCV